MDSQRKAELRYPLNCGVYGLILLEALALNHADHILLYTYNFVEVEYQIKEASGSLFSYRDKLWSSLRTSEMLSVMSDFLSVT